MSDYKSWLHDVFVNGRGPLLHRLDAEWLEPGSMYGPRALSWSKEHECWQLYFGSSNYTILCSTWNQAWDIAWRVPK